MNNMEALEKFKAKQDTRREERLRVAKSLADTFWWELERCEEDIEEVYPENTQHIKIVNAFHILKQKEDYQEAKHFDFWIGIINEFYNVNLWKNDEYKHFVSDRKEFEDNDYDCYDDLKCLKNLTT